MSASIEEALRPLVARLVAEELDRRAAAPVEFLTVEESAAFAKVSPSTVRRWIARGELAADRVGPRVIRVRHADLEAMLRAGRRSVDADAGLTPEALAKRDFG